MQSCHRMFHIMFVHATGAAAVYHNIIVAAELTKALGSPLAMVFSQITGEWAAVGGPHGGT